MLLLFLVGPSVIGSIMGFVVAYDQRQRVKRRMIQIQKQIAELMVFHGADLRPFRETVSEILSGHQCEVHEATEDALVFSHPWRGEQAAWHIAFWSVFTLGGAFVYLVVLYVLVPPGARHELQLAP